jgi:hypothetical protein
MCSFYIFRAKIAGKKPIRLIMMSTIVQRRLVCAGYKRKTPNTLVACMGDIQSGQRRRTAGKVENG